MSLPQHCPSARELDDLELFAVGAVTPARFEDADGLLTLVVPDAVAAAAHEAGAVELVEPEGMPIARVRVESTYAAPAGTGIVGPVETLARNDVGPFRRLYLSPAEVTAQHPDALTVPVTAPLTASELAVVRDAAAARPVLLLALAGTGTPVGTDPVGLIRSTLAAADELTAAVVAVPLASHGDAETDHALGTTVVAAYAPGEILALPTPTEAEEPVTGPDVSTGVVVFFTGLSGSGKSTIARALTDVVLESGARTVTSLDGDIVRRNLSAGLTFSREDRETNIRRIGWVAAEIARHGGMAICSPIAPFDQTRKQVRQFVDDAGGDFILIHVSTPLEECERRDKKGLYAKARAGEIPEFTGISSPYEPPTDADLVVDTTGRTLDDCILEVLELLDPYLR